MRIPSTSVTLETWRALLQGRRLLPLIGASVALLTAQWAFYPDVEDFLVGVSLCLSAILLAPVAYRLLFPHDIDSAWNVMRLVLYGFLSAGVVIGVGRTLPSLVGINASFMTQRPDLVVSVVLFLVGGWAIGRDINLALLLTREQGRTASLEREAQQAQILALRAHLDPHFLFNTLNAIAEWCRQDGQVAESAVLKLSDMLRLMMTGVRTPTWTLAQELELVRMLWDLHLLRDPHLFQLRIDAPTPLPEIQVPPMILLPLAENAVKHGPAAGHRGEIVLTLRLNGHDLGVSLENPGPYRGPRPGSEGVPTVQRRLDLAYAGGARISIRGSGHDRTRVDVDLPLHIPAHGLPS